MKYDNYKNLPVVNSPKTFAKKSPKVLILIRESLQILSCLGIPIETISERKREKMAMAFLAVGNVKSLKKWKNIKDANTDYSVTTKEII